MKKVSGVCLLKKTHSNWELKIFNEKYIIQQCLEQWKKSDDAVSIELEFVIKSKFQFKTQSQLGYLHAAIKPVIIMALQMGGDERRVDKIWDDVKTELGFLEERVDVYGKNYTLPMSSRDASKEQMSEFIDRLIRWAAEWGIHIESPDEYQKRMGFKQWK